MSGKLLLKLVRQSNTHKSVLKYVAALVALYGQTLARPYFSRKCVIQLIEARLNCSGTIALTLLAVCTDVILLVTIPLTLLTVCIDVVLLVTWKRRKRRYICLLVYPCLILLQIKLDKRSGWSPPPEFECHPKSKLEDDDDPGLRIRYAQDIHNCLSLLSAATVGPAMDFPSLTPGEKSLVKVARKV